MSNKNHKFKEPNDIATLVTKVTNPFNGIDDLTMKDDFEGVRLLEHE